MDKIYYAHSKIIYGSKREVKERKFLEKKFIVLCPNRDIGEKGFMEPYLQAIKGCSKVICSEYSGYIGRGVFEEVKSALEDNKPVLCLRLKKSKFNLIEVINVEIVDECDWKFQYGKLILS